MGICKVATMGDCQVYEFINYVCGMYMWYGVCGAEGCVYDGWVFSMWYVVYVCEVCVVYVYVVCVYVCLYRKDKCSEQLYYWSKHSDLSKK